MSRDHDWDKLTAKINAQRRGGHDPAVVKSAVKASNAEAAYQQGAEDERLRCLAISPEGDLDKATDAYSDGYLVGFADAVARYRDKIRGRVE